ncbi:hypothetical protein [Shewanella sp. P1-14-1]|uniref:hypothetical protein n=1 Tax=Shewanella sp. P1-14-1 TaxID=1723761 RepID=UPI0006D67EEF|nr:hypothetical protein [Shewanella sp. P1-14-1]
MDKSTVEYVRVDVSGKGIVKFTKKLTNSPAGCGNGHPQHLSFNTNTAAGRAIMSIALTAHASGKTISARGTGGCGHYGTVETWSWGLVNK